MTLQDLAGRVEESMGPVAKLLADLGVQLQALHAVGFYGSEHLGEMTRQFEGVARRALVDRGGLVAGLGVVWEAAGNGERGMLWWRADDGEVTRKIHVDNPQSDSFYDFAHSEWYQSAIGSQGVVIVGPYIDAWGTDDHALTPSLSVSAANGERIGVAAIDLDVHRTTEMLARVLAGEGDGVVLLNSDDQVVAANAPSLTAGLRLEPFLRRRSLAAADETRLAAIAGWRLVRLS